MPCLSHSSVKGGGLSSSKLFRRAMKSSVSAFRITRGYIAQTCANIAL